MEIIHSHAEVGIEAAKVKDTRGIFFVPAFNGLFAPRWRSDARGVIVGLTGSETKSHLCRAVLESVGYQAKEICDAMRTDSQTNITMLKVDGGMTTSDIFLQIQADILGVDIKRPNFSETTVLGAAFAAGLHVGVYTDSDADQSDCSTFSPQISEELRSANVKLW
eukprot:CAMPEP_0117008806 /NCGR_PEP_ID=MMETSP0472-20121206/8184_1 /TAXON_ID=693140 ORGANISM="Tiarina fusus, Strain LIS" /NCGR_SAMPLE_ID=MMETSP0472 /ASSEMBLY_ACC=CAM_ASM_000603 /LENGTH=164 /DNA_ID=CAMNT_0004710939 /DNA_START=870 /DNA_END=1361 /DNA_ORIENTATION=+